MLGELGHQDVEQDLFLLDDEALDVGADGGELLAGRQAARRRTGDAGRHLILQRRDSHLEELVEVRRADRDELQPIEQRNPRLLGQGQNA